VAGALAIESNPGRWATGDKGSAEEHRLRFLLRLMIFQRPHVNFTWSSEPKNSMTRQCASIWGSKSTGCPH